MAEITALYKFRWPTLEMFDLETRPLVWHGFFTSRICDDPDLKFLKQQTREAIRIEMTWMLEWCLGLAVACGHENIIEKFIDTAPAFQVYGVFFICGIGEVACFCVFYVRSS